MATVKDGLVTALKGGNVTIRARVAYGYEAECHITVKPQYIQIEPDSITLKMNQRGILKAMLKPQNIPIQSVKWKSENENIAVVKRQTVVYPTYYEEVVVSPISRGKTRIIATTEDGSNLSAYCDVTVDAEIKVSQIILDPESINGQEGERVQIKATVLPEDAEHKALRWISFNENVATVDENGIVSLLKEGSTWIRAYNNVRADCQVTVFKPTISVSSILLNPSSAEGNEGDQIRINATVLPEDATNKLLTWSSSDESVATVDETGLISLIKKGATVIVASATDDSGVSAESDIVVTEYSGIDSILADKDTYVKIFNLSGTLIYEGMYSHAKLASDYYIVVCDGKGIKVKVE